jgi:acyl-CoA synthetase (AMP-forming)/AMP-acid ligase II
VIVMAEGGGTPATPLPAPVSYEALLAGVEPLREWPAVDEWDPAGMCYSSATTGLPKGVTYTHRALWLHSMAWGLADTGGVSEQDTMLIIVPMFHANAWGLPFSGVWFGATQVLPGPRPDAAVFCRLMERERVTLAAGVPTVWMGVLDALDREPADLSGLTRIICGGSAPPRALIERVETRLGVRFIHAYGMTEAAPLTHSGGLKSTMRDWDEPRQYAVKAKQGLLLPGLEMRVVAPDGTDVPWDGRTMGEVWLRGPWIADEYYHDPRSADTFRDGWYRTGDVGCVDAEGYLSRHRRPRQRHHQVGRRVDLVGGVRERDHGAPGRGGGRGRGRGARQMAGAAAGLRRAQARRLGHKRRHPGAPPPRVRPLVGARRRRLHPGGAEDERRQVRQEGPPGALRRAPHGTGSARKRSAGPAPLMSPAPLAPPRRRAR